MTPIGGGERLPVNSSDFPFAKPDARMLLGEIQREGRIFRLDSQVLRVHANGVRGEFRLPVVGVFSVPKFTRSPDLISLDGMGFANRWQADELINQRYFKRVFGVQLAYQELDPSGRTTEGAVTIDGGGVSSVLRVGDLGYLTLSEQAALGGLLVLPNDLRQTASTSGLVVIDESKRYGMGMYDHPELWIESLALPGDGGRLTVSEPHNVSKFSSEGQGAGNNGPVAVWRRWQDHYSAR